MKRNYKDIFNPTYLNCDRDNNILCSNYYIEIGRECYKYPGLKNKKNDILVYGVILAGLNNPLSDTFSYTNKYIADRISLDEREVRRSTSSLEQLEILKITHPTKNKRNIKVDIDLRYSTNELNKRKRKKSVIKIYDRIFSYPLITKPMVHVYSYYLALTNIPGYKGYTSVSYKKVAEALGYSEKQVMKIMRDMENIGLIKITRLANSKIVSLLVDFSQKQPEEIEFEKQESERRKEALNNLDYVVSGTPTKSKSDTEYSSSWEDNW